MNFEIEKSKFLAAVQKAQSVVDKRQAMSLLSNVRLKVENQQLELVATDLEVGLKDTVEVTVHSEGSIAVSAKILYDVLRELPDSIVKFQVEDNHWIRLNCGNSDFRIVGTSDEDFPTLPEIDEKILIKIPGDLLDTLTRKTSYSVSHDESRKILNGVLFKVTPTIIRMVATDGHRMAFIETGNNLNLSEFEVILPQKAVHEIQRMIGSGCDELFFGIMEKHIVFRSGNETIVTRIIDGQFPNYTMVIPKETQYEIKISKESLFTALRRVALFSDVKARGVKMQFSNNMLQINANTPEYGEAKEEIAIEYSGEQLLLGFNVTYLLDILKCIDSEEVIIRINNVSGPVAVLPAVQTEFNYITIVMPMIM